MAPFEHRPAFRFNTPSSMMIVGPLGCGKTVFTTKLLVDNPDLFETPPKKIYYCYGSWQDGFKRMKQHGIKFHEGIPDSELLPVWFPKGGLLVLDDLWKKEATTNASWISSPNILIIKTSRFSICVKTCFHPGNLPRASPGTRTTLWVSRIPAIDWGCVICYCKRFPRDGKRCKTPFEKSLNALLVTCYWISTPRAATTSVF